ncbi:MAG: hypothetical protein KGJ62_06270 [Armatimonadetes bacterium]|nr:hypothetical protein [Armatimonadota bacterium]MDE2205882.1 hypothetical protein [Armatimonadota bacterium]
MQPPIPPSVRDVRLVAPDDPGFRDFLAAIRQRRVGRWGRRAAGEALGGLAEAAIRAWLAERLTLSPERIIQWQQRLANGRFGPLYRELDAVSITAPGELCIFEIKLTTEQAMAAGAGLKQLGLAAALLEHGGWSRIVKRVVYAAERVVEVCAGEVPTVECTELDTPLGVIWPPAAEVEAMALAHQPLPANWLDPESRIGEYDDPKDREWRAVMDAAAAAAPPPSAMAEAMQRAMNAAHQSAPGAEPDKKENRRPERE